MSTDGSVTDSFSEDEIEYSPKGFDPTSMPRHLERKIILGQPWNEILKASLNWTGKEECRTTMLIQRGEILEEEMTIIISSMKSVKQSLVDMTRSIYDWSKKEFPKTETWYDMVLADALIFFPHLPVTALTFTKDGKKVDHEIRRHNTNLASWLTATLRETDGSISVVHGVADINDDLSERLDTLRQQKMCFAFSDSLMMTPERCKNVLKGLRPLLWWSSVEDLFPEELGHDYFLVTDVLMEELTDEPCKLDSDDKTFESLEMDQENRVDGKEGKPWVISLLVLQYAVHCYQFSATYNSEVQGSKEFAQQKIMPVVYLFLEVLRLHRQSSHKQIWFLLLALLMFCVGDVIFVWKHFYLDLGLFAFALAHLSSAFAFEFRFDKPKVFLFFAVLGTAIFSFFEKRIENLTFYISAAYTFSVCLMSWRAAADITSPIVTKKRKYLQGASIVSFIFCNVIIAFEVFHHPFTGSHLLSMVTYHLALFSLTLSVLLKYDVIKVSEDSKKRTIDFVVQSAMSFAMPTCFQLLSMATNI